MHKCPKCGTEFEGKFCPDCGTQWQEEKTCPQCGATLSGSARFCNECGYAFYKSEKKTAKPSAVKEKFNKALSWVKSHLKIVVPVAVAIVLIIVLSCSIPAVVAGKTNGTYYKFKGGELDKTSYFIITSGKWEDNDGTTGTYKKDGEEIIFYTTVFGETTELTKGTIKDGVLTVNNNTYVSEKHRHNYSEWKTSREPTCVTNGLKIRSCACGVKETEEIQPSGVHTYGEWQTTKEPTCISEGVQTKTCTVCKKKETQSINALGHNLRDICNFDYTGHYKSCTRCDQFFKELHNGTEKCEACGCPLIDTVGLKYELNSDKKSYTVIGIGSSTESIIRIPETYNELPVTSIGDSAFNWCSGLTSIVIPNSVTSIGDSAFSGCSGLTSVVIPDSVTRIYDKTFNGCRGLTSVVIPNSVTSIGSYAFEYCKELKDITFKGSQAQWNAIKKDSSWDSGTVNYTIHCTDGDIKKS